MAQLGARFHGMEEVIGSIPIRSTNKPHNLRIQISEPCYGSDTVVWTLAEPACSGAANTWSLVTYR